MKDFNTEIVDKLKGRLEWYTYDATDQEYDDKEVETIVKMLEIADHTQEEDSFRPEEGLKRLKAKYPFITRQYLSQSTRKKDYRRLKFIAAATIAGIVIMFMGMNIGTYATTSMGFFEFISHGADEVGFLFTGEPDELEFTQEKENNYGSLEELRLEYPAILLPKTAPEDMELEYIRSSDFFDYDMLGIRYMRYGYDREIHLTYYIDVYNKAGWQSFEHTTINIPLGTDTINGLQVYFYTDGGERDEEIMAYFFDGNAMYRVFGNVTKEDIMNFIESLK